MNIKRLYVIIIAVILIGGGAGIYFLKFQKTVEVGDTVYINYIFYLDTGEIVDTTLEEVAMDDTQPKYWQFRLKASYEPLKLVIGKGNLLPDLELALIGMREGQKKEVTIPPERAYGYRDPSKIREVALIQTLNIQEEVTLDEFKQRVDENPQPDEYYQFQDMTILVLEVKDDTVLFKYELTMGQEIRISLGNAQVTEVTDTEYKLTLNPSLGDVVLGSGVVTEIKEDVMLVDFNYLLAGETLHYTIWVVTIEKA